MGRFRMQNHQRKPQKTLRKVGSVQLKSQGEESSKEPAKFHSDEGVPSFTPTAISAFTPTVWKKVDDEDTSAEKFLAALQSLEAKLEARIDVLEKRVDTALEQEFRMREFQMAANKRLETLEKRIDVALCQKFGTPGLQMGVSKAYQDQVIRRRTDAFPKIYVGFKPKVLEDGKQKVETKEHRHLGEGPNLNWNRMVLEVGRRWSMDPLLDQSAWSSDFVREPVEEEKSSSRFSLWLFNLVTRFLHRGGGETFKAAKLQNRLEDSRPAPERHGLLGVMRWLLQKNKVYPVFLSPEMASANAATAPSLYPHGTVPSAGQQHSITEPGLWKNKGFCRDSGERKRRTSYIET